MSWNYFFRSPNNGENIEAKVERQNQCWPGPKSADICEENSSFQMLNVKSLPEVFYTSFQRPRLVEFDAVKKPHEPYVCRIHEVEYQRRLRSLHGLVHDIGQFMHCSKPWGFHRFIIDISGPHVPRH